MSTTIKCSRVLRIIVIGVVLSSFASLQGCGGTVATYSTNTPEDSGAADSSFTKDAASDALAGDVKDTAPVDIGRDDGPVQPDNLWGNDARARVCMQFGKGWKSAECRTCLEQGPPTFSQFEGAMKAFQDLECEASLGCVLDHCLMCLLNPCEADTCKCIERCMPRGNERCMNAWQDHMAATLQTCSSVCE